MRKTLLAVFCCAALLSLPGFAGDNTKGPACCAKKAGATQTSQRMRCTLTGKEVDKCCCEKREGKLHCTLADKDVEKCCCVQVKGEQTKTPAKS